MNLALALTQPLPHLTTVSTLEAMAALTMGDSTQPTPNPSPRSGAYKPIDPLQNYRGEEDDGVIGALNGTAVAVVVPAGDKWSVVRNNVAQEMYDRKELNDVFEERERQRTAAEKVSHHISYRTNIPYSHIFLY